MPTLSGMRRRGFPPAALRQMCDLIGVTKAHKANEHSKSQKTDEQTCICEKSFLLGTRVA
eukprot:1184313-Amphidinium_carterae.1